MKKNFCFFIALLLGCFYSSVFMACGMDACNHEGGNRTCVEKAVCTRCNQQYGDLAEHNYEWGKCVICDAVDPSYIAQIDGFTSEENEVFFGIKDNVNILFELLMSGGYDEIEYNKRNNKSSFAIDLYSDYARIFYSTPPFDPSVYDPRSFRNVLIFANKRNLSDVQATEEYLFARKDFGVITTEDYEYALEHSQYFENILCKFMVSFKDEDPENPQMWAVDFVFFEEGTLAQYDNDILEKVLFIFDEFDSETRYSVCENAFVRFYNANGTSIDATEQINSVFAMLFNYLSQHN